MTTLNVADFGPLGAADDSATIQAALDAAFALADPAITEVVLAPGTYLLQHRVNIGSYTRFVCTGATIRRNSNAADDLLRCRNVAPVTGYTGEHDWEVVGGTWDGNRAAFPVIWNLVSFGHCRNVAIRGATFIHGGGAHCIECNSSQQVLIQDCRFEDTPVGANVTEAMHIDGAYSTGTFPMFGAWDQTACDGLRIERCVFRGVDDGIGSHTVVAGHPHTNLLVIGCDVEAAGVGLKLRGYEGVVLIGNRVWSAGGVPLELWNTVPTLIDGTARTEVPPPPPIPEPGDDTMFVPFYVNDDNAKGYHSNAPTGYVELWGLTNRRLLLPLTDKTRAYVTVAVKQAGAVGATLVLRYSTDGGATFADLCAAPIGAVGSYWSGWVDLPVAARSLVLVSPWLLGGNGVADPGFAYVGAEFAA